MNAFLHYLKRGLKTRIIYRGAVFITILALTFAPFSPTLQKQEAHALFGAGDIVLDPTNLIQTTATAISATALELKELGLDGVANALMKQAVRQMTTSIVRWINSGFEGSPAFVTDLGGFLRDVADQVAGEFIYGSELSFLCSPFELNIRAALEIQYNQTFEEQAACTITDILNNVDGAVGSVSDAMNNWDDWFQVTTVQQNNQYGAYILAQEKLNADIAEKQRNASDEIQQGNGFLSLKTCVEVNGKQQCKVVTPGKVISEQLTKALGASQDTLITADEINEVVSALFAQLAQQALTGAGGLLGLSSGSGGSSYLDQVDNDDSTVGLSDNSANPITQSLKTEKDVQVIYLETLDLIDKTEIKAANKKCDPTLSISLKATKTGLNTSIVQNTSTIAQLELLSSQYEQSSEQKKKNTVYQDYLKLRSNGTLHSSFDVLDLNIQLDDLKVETDDFLKDCS